MAILNLLDQYSPTYLLPDLNAALLELIKGRLRDDIGPIKWKTHLDLEKTGSYSQEFLDDTNRVVEESVKQFIAEGKIAPLDEKQIRFLVDSLWGESQRYWYIYAQELMHVFNFIDNIYYRAEKEIEALFPHSEKIFGPMAKSLLIDLEYQYDLYALSRNAKPDLIDFRRMINICGQIIESIFGYAVFNQEMLIGLIKCTLESYRSVKNEERRWFFSKFPSGNLLQKQDFINRLEVIRKIRNAYSHGLTPDVSITSDFQKCIEALLGDKNGLLYVLYDVLTHAKRIEC